MLYLDVILDPYGRESRQYSGDSNALLHYHVRRSPDRVVAEPLAVRRAEDAQHRQRHHRQLVRSRDPPVVPRRLRHRGRHREHGVLRLRTQRHPTRRAHVGHPLRGDLRQHVRGDLGNRAGGALWHVVRQAPPEPAVRPHLRRLLIGIISHTPCATETRSRDSSWRRVSVCANMSLYGQADRTRKGDFLSMRRMWFSVQNKRMG